MNPDGEESNSSLLFVIFAFLGVTFVFPSIEQVVERRDAEPEAERH